jgi:hypothetical protein
MRRKFGQDIFLTLLQFTKSDQNVWRNGCLIS